MHIAYSFINNGINNEVGEIAKSGPIDEHGLREEVIEFLEVMLEKDKVLRKREKFFRRETLEGLSIKAHILLPSHVHISMERLSFKG